MSSQQPFEVNVSRHFVSWLPDSRVSLALTTYQTNRLFLKGETLPERNETFFVLLSNASGASITDGTGVGKIKNDD